MNLKLFQNYGGIYRFEKKIKKYSGEINPLGVHRNMRGRILEVNFEGLEVVIKSIFFYHFVDLDLSIETFLKKGAIENGPVDF